MNMRKKFGLLIGGNILAFLLAIGVYVLVQIPISRMEAEQKILDDLGYAIRDLRTEINLLDNASFRSQMENIKKSKLALDESFRLMGTLRYLSASNAEIRNALDITQNLEKLFSENWTVFIATYEKLDELLNLLTFMDDLTIVSATRIENFSSPEAIADGTMDKTKSLWDKLQGYTSVLETNLESSATITDKQFSNIRETINRIKRQAFLFSLGIMITVILAIFIIILIFTRKLGRIVRNIAGTIKELFSGNLMVHLSVLSRDELGILSRNLNNFITQLRAGLTDIKNSAAKNVAIEAELSEIVRNTTDKARVIGTNSSQIVGVIGTLEEGIQDSLKAVDIVAGGVEKLSDQIINQMSMVEESSSAVTQMIVSIGNVADITARKEKATEMLVKTAKTGGEQLNVTTRIIQEINGSVDEISGTAGVIQNVASQTTLLAMNAAIEAAHAGESGRGFAVVADEIRKLAETSSQNSKRITGVIKEVVAKIEEAVNAGSLTQQAFSDIDREVLGVSESLKEISSSMEELNLGGTQILQAMTELQEVSVAVKSGGDDMVKASGELNQGIGEVVNISRSVKTDTENISSAIRGIIGSMETVTSRSGDLNRITCRLNDEVQKYKTAEEETGPEECHD